jgi:hypothetical protein
VLGIDSGSIQALLRLYSGSFEALLKLFSGSVEALLRLCQRIKPFVRLY